MYAIRSYYAICATVKIEGDTDPELYEKLVGKSAAQVRARNNFV